MSWWSDLADKLHGLFVSVPGGFDWQTAGPDEDEHPFAPLANQAWSNQGPGWVDGWWGGARRTPAHPGRIGPTIIPRAAVVHTTDTLDGFGAIVKSWTSSRGAGNAATFMIGRSSADGIVQFCPITRNANHAGGTPHGSFQAPTTGLIHPNTVSVGIELVAGGILRKQVGGWYHADSCRFVPATDVQVDARGQGWHRVTDYQYGALDQLLTALDPQMQGIKGLAAVPDGDYGKNGVPWAPIAGSIVGHVTLDPINKLDPGPFVMQHLRGFVL